MRNLFEYIAHPAGRAKVITALGVFSVIGALVVSSVLLVAAFGRPG